MRLIDLMRMRAGGVSIRQDDVRLARYGQLCDEAHAGVEAALARMGECHAAQDHAGWDAALGDFDRAMRLYAMADEMLDTDGHG